jgi:hypothetical protein
MSDLTPLEKLIESNAKSVQALTDSVASIWPRLVGLTQALPKQSGSWLRSGYTNQAF